MYSSAKGIPDLPLPFNNTNCDRDSPIQQYVLPLNSKTTRQSQSSSTAPIYGIRPYEAPLVSPEVVPTAAAKTMVTKAR